MTFLPDDCSLLECDIVQSSRHLPTIRNAGKFLSDYTASHPIKRLTFRLTAVRTSEVGCTTNENGTVKTEFDSNIGQAEHFPSPKCPEPLRPTRGYRGVIPRGKAARNVKLIAHLHTLPNVLRIIRSAIPPLPHTSS